MRWIVTWAWNVDPTVTSCTAVEAESETGLRLWARLTHKDHTVVGVEPHWNQGDPEDDARQVDR